MMESLDIMQLIASGPTVLAIVFSYRIALRLLDTIDKGKFTLTIRHHFGDES